MLSKCTSLHSLYFLLLYIFEVINTNSLANIPPSIYFRSPVLCVHLDRVCALLSDPNNWYQS